MARNLRLELQGSGQKGQNCSPSLLVDGDLCGIDQRRADGLDIGVVGPVQRKIEAVDAPAEKTRNGPLNDDGLSHGIRSRPRVGSSGSGERCGIYSRAKLARPLLYWRPRGARQRGEVGDLLRQQPIAEISDRPFKSVRELDGRLPGEHLTRERDIGLALFRVVRRQRLEYECAC